MPVQSKPTNAPAQLFTALAEISSRAEGCRRLLADR
jgi:hypothetical protein